MWLRSLLVPILILLLLTSVVSADYIIPIEALTNSPLDSVNNFLGNFPYAPNATGNRQGVNITIPGTITGVEIYDYSGTAGTAENYTYYIRVNDTTDYWIQNRTVAASERVFTNFNLNIPVSQATSIEIKRVHPAWATNPLTNIVGGYVYVNTSIPGYILWGQQLSSSPADNTIYYSGTKPDAMTTTAGRAKIYVPANGTIESLAVIDVSRGQQGTNEAFGFRLRKNTDTGLMINNQSVAAIQRYFTCQTMSMPVYTNGSDYIEFMKYGGAWATNPLLNTIGAQAFVNMSAGKSATTDNPGYALPIQALTSSPGDGATVYLGNMPKAPTTTAAASKIYIRSNGTIRYAEVYTYSGTAGTAESWSMYVRKNNTEDFLISTLAVSASERRFYNRTINLSVVPGDYLEIKGVQPSWATNPLTTIYGGYLWNELKVRPNTTFIANTTGGYAPLAALFNDTSNNFPETWNWSYKNVTGNNTEVWWTVTQNSTQLFGVGNWSIKLNASNWGGSNISPQVTFVNVSQLPAPVASFTKNVSAMLQPGALQGNDTSTGTPTMWNWSWGDTSWTNTSTESARNASHVYSTGGTYNIFLIAQNGGGSSQSDPQTLNVYNQTAASFTKNQTELVVPPNQVLGLNSTSKNATWWNWSFHDGTWYNTSDIALRNTSKIYSTGGNFSISLRVSDSGWGTTTSYGNISVYNQTIANIIQNKTEAIVPPNNAVSFNTTSNNATWWNWSFHDNTWFNTTDIAARNTSKIYSTAGNFTVNITTSNDGRGVNTAYSFVNIYSQSAAGFSANVTSGLQPLPVKFTDASFNATAWYWMFGDGQTSTTQSPEHVYSTGGIYTVRLNASNAKSFSWENKTDYITVNNRTVSGFNANVTSGNAPLPVGFNVTIPNDNATMWNWSFGDLAWQNGTTQNGTHLYTIPGIFTVTEIASNPYHTNTTTRTDYITVYNVTPPLSITGLDNVTTCNSINWTWTNPADGDFNRTMIWRNNIFQYNRSNSTTFDLWTTLTELTAYTFSSKTCDIDGNCNATFENKTSTTLACGSPPVADFTANLTTACSGQNISFTDLSTNIPTSWYWEFGDSGTSADQNPIKSYAITGLFDVKLKATNAYGEDEEQKDHYINITDCTPPAGITNLANVTTCNSINWTWTKPADADFNHTMIWRDNIFQYNLSNTAVFDLWTSLAENTAYTVSTKTCDVIGNCNTSFVNLSSTTLFCGIVPVANFTADYTTVCDGTTIQFNDTSTGSPTNWWYLFGDSQDSHLQNATHSYDTAGIYDVSFRAGNGYGNDWENKTGFIDVSDCTPPQAISGLGNTSSTCNSLNWNWTNPPNSDFNYTVVWKNNVWYHNVTNASSTDLWGSLSQLTSYTFSAKTVDIAGNQNDTWVNLTRSTPECSDITPPSPITNLDNTTTTCNSITWVWDNPPEPDFDKVMIWKNNTLFEQLSVETTTWSGLSGLTSYTFSSKTKDTLGNVNDNWVNMTIQTPECVTPPVAAFSANETSVCVNDYIKFTDASTNTPTSWHWLFGDGNSSVDQNPVTSYTFAGLFDVTLEATNAGGSDEEIKLNYINVSSCTPPITDFTYNATCGVMNLTVQFTDTSTEFPTTWYWEFGDGNTSVIESPIFRYNVTGNWSVNHSSTNTYGTAWENKTQVFRVLPLGSSCSPAGGSGGGWSIAPDETTSWTALFFAMFGIPVIFAVMMVRRK